MSYGKNTKAAGNEMESSQLTVTVSGTKAGVLVFLTPPRQLTAASESAMHLKKWADLQTFARRSGRDRLCVLYEERARSTSGAAPEQKTRQD